MGMSSQHELASRSRHERVPVARRNGEPTFRVET
jgi:hypothetical protein